MALTLTIVICTRDRASSLLQVLASLDRQTLPPQGVVVVDNGSTDETRAVATADPRVRYLFRPNLGLAACRQNGIDVSATDGVVMCDDDCVPEPRWLEIIERTFASDPQIAVVAGGIENHGFADNLKGRGGLGPNGLYQLIANPAEAQFFGSANMALRKAAITHIGGYDTSFTRGYEEVDLLTRVRAAGYAVRYEPAALLHHHHVVSAARPRLMHRSRQGMRLYFFFKHYWPGSLGEWAAFLGREAVLVAHDIKIAGRTLYRAVCGQEKFAGLPSRTAALLIDRLLLPRWMWMAAHRRAPGVQPISL